MKSVLPIILAVLSSISTVWATSTSEDCGATSTPAPRAGAPLWGKLILAGNVVTCYYAKGTATPTKWTQLGQPQTLNLVNNALLAGMYVTAHNANNINTGTIDNFSITPASSFRLADVDIGSPALMGSANVIDNVWTLSGSGADIWGTGDQFNFQPWLITGDCTIICRVTSIGARGDPWEKIGIMIRDGYNSGSDYAMFCATLSEGVDFQYRLGFNNNADQMTFITPPSGNVTSSVNVGYGPTSASAYQLRP